MTRKRKQRHVDDGSSMLQIRLTPRELETLTWVGKGKTYGEIATIFDIAEDTVKSCIEDARKKLNASNRTHAVVAAIKAGLIKINDI